MRVSSASSECNERFRRIGKCWRPYSRIRTISILPGKGDKYKRLKALDHFKARKMPFWVGHSNTVTVVLAR